MNENTVKLLSNLGGAGFAGLAVGDWIGLVPPKYQPVAMLAVAIAANLIGLYQKSPAKDK